MRFHSKTFALALGVVTLSLGSLASAQCGGYARPAAYNPGSLNAQPRLLHTAFDQGREEHDPIVGLWHVKFLSKGSAGIPDGTEVDYGYSTWHSDGTELLNSGHMPPKTSNFCQGVWKQISHDTYKLNHFAIAWDPSGSYLVGPANIREQVKLSDCNHYKGTFSIDQYDESGTLLLHIQGTITGVRVEVDTKPSSIE